MRQAFQSSKSVLRKRRGGTVTDHDPSAHDAEENDIEGFLAQRADMDREFKERFTKNLSVMFTDLKGSTSIAESEGDLATRLLIKEHNAVVFPAISDNNGVLVKTIGDGTLSYFHSPQDAVRTAVRIQKGIDALNMEKKFRVPVLIRVGVHTGEVIFEKSDIFGDVVNTASRFESSANAGEIQISQETFDGLKEKGEFLIRYIKEIQLKGKSAAIPVYKVYWNPVEFEEEGIATQEKAAQKEPMNPALKLAIIILVPLFAMFLFIQMNDILTRTGPDEERRSILHSAEPSNLAPSDR